MTQNYGLGRGLSSLIPQKDQKSSSSKFDTSSDKFTSEEEIVAAGAKDGNLKEIDINSIIVNPYQPRHYFDEEKLKELSDSIQKHGIIQPVVVSKNGDQYELIAGERRFQAAQKAGLKKVPAVVKKIKEKEKLELAIIENIQRHNLNPIEEAKAYQKLMDDFDIHQDEVAEKMGISRSSVANKVRLLSLAVNVQKALMEDKITEGHAKVLLSVEDKEKQKALLQTILKGNLTVRQSEDKAKEVSVKPHKRNISIDPEVRSLEDKLTEIFGTKVKVKKAGKEGGKIVIDYYSKEDLNSLINKVS